MMKINTNSHDFIFIFEVSIFVVRLIPTFSLLKYRYVKFVAQIIYYLNNIVMLFNSPTKLNIKESQFSR